MYIIYKSQFKLKKIMEVNNNGKSFVSYQLSNVQFLDNYSTQPNGASSYLTDLPGFEPGLEAPEASVISMLHDRPN